MGGPINIFDQSASQEAFKTTQLTALSELSGSAAAFGALIGGLGEQLDNQRFLVVPDEVKNEVAALSEIIVETMPAILSSIAQASGLQGINEFATMAALGMFVEGWDAYFRGQPASGSNTDDLSSLLEDFLSEDCGNPDCLVHGVGGIADDLRDMMRGFAATGTNDPFPIRGDGLDGFSDDLFGFGTTDDGYGFDDAPDWFGRNGYTDQQRDFITGQADTPGCGNPDCPVCNGTFAGASLDFEEIDPSDIDPESPMAQAFAAAGINVTDGRIFGARIG